MLKTWNFDGLDYLVAKRAAQAGRVGKTLKIAFCIGLIASALTMGGCLSPADPEQGQGASQLTIAEKEALIRREINNIVADGVSPTAMRLMALTNSNNFRANSVHNDHKKRVAQRARSILDGKNFQSEAMLTVNLLTGDKKIEDLVIHIWPSGNGNGRTEMRRFGNKAEVAPGVIQHGIITRVVECMSARPPLLRYR